MTVNTFDSNLAFMYATIPFSKQKNYTWYNLNTIVTDLFSVALFFTPKIISGDVNRLCKCVFVSELPTKLQWCRYSPIWASTIVAHQRLSPLLFIIIIFLHSARPQQAMPQEAAFFLDFLVVYRPLIHPRVYFLCPRELINTRPFCLQSLKRHRCLLILVDLCPASLRLGLFPRTDLPDP